MEDSNIENLLDEAQDLFNRSGHRFEDGLKVDDPALLQLRKACRLLEAARFLQEKDGYYTVTVETSFAAIERTIQFYLLETGLLHEDEFVNHETVYQDGIKAGLYNQEFADKLAHLWRNNRSRTYYREGIATQDRAEKMLELAEAIHSHITQLAGQSHGCICNNI